MVVKISEAKLPAVRNHDEGFNPMDTTPRIINNKDDLFALIKSAHLTGRQYVAMVHLALVNSIYHLAKHGRSAPMNRLYNDLTPALQLAVKNYVAENCKGTYRDEATGESKVEFFLKHTNKDGWFLNIVKDNQGKKIRDRAAVSRESWVSNPEPYLAIDFAKQQVRSLNPLMDDAQVLKLFDGLIKRASKDDATVSPAVLKVLQAAREDATKVALTLKAAQAA